MLGGQSWANDGQSFATVKSLKCFHGGADENFFFCHNFFLKVGKRKLWVGKGGQTMDKRMSSSFSKKSILGVPTSQTYNWASYFVSHDWN